MLIICKGDINLKNYQAMYSLEKQIQEAEDKICSLRAKLINSSNKSNKHIQKQIKEQQILLDHLLEDEKYRQFETNNINY